MNVKSIVAAMALAVFLGTPAFAADRLEKGTWAIGVGANPALGTWSPHFRIYVADNFSLAVQYGVTAITLDYGAGVPKDDVTVGLLSLSGTFDIPTNGSIVPFVGGGVRVFNNTDDSVPVEITSTSLGISGGIRIMAKPDRSINVGLDVWGGTLDEDVSASSVDFSGAQLELSYSLYF